MAVCLKGIINGNYTAAKQIAAAKRFFFGGGGGTLPFCGFFKPPFFSQRNYFPNFFFFHRF